MASRHMKWEFGTKLCYLQGIRARQSARYIDGMMRAQKPNNVGALANLIKVSAKSQITIAQHSLDSSAPDTNFIQKIWFSQPSDQDESLFFSASDLLLQLSPRNCVLLPHGSMNGNKKKQIKILLCELCEESIAVAATNNLSREWLKNDIYLIKNVVWLDSSIRLNLWLKNLIYMTSENWLQYFHITRRQT